MKRFLSITVALLLILCGCQFSDRIEHPVRFYYVRQADRFVYGSGDGVITYEERDAAGHEADLRYLLSLYLQGPLDEGLRSPFPPECKLLTMSNKDRTVTLVLSESFADLSGLDRSLAYACLGYTCANLDTIETMHILVLNKSKQVILDETISIPSLLPPEVTPSTEANQ